MLYLVIIIGVAAMIAGTNVATWNLTSSYYKAQEAKVVAETAAAEANRRAELATRVATLEREQAVVREVEVVKWRTIKKEVERVVKSDPVYVRLDCRVTDDGVRLYNAAAAGLQLAAADGKDAAVPQKPAAAEAERDPGRPTGNGGVGLRAIPRLPSGS